MKALISKIDPLGTLPGPVRLSFLPIPKYDICV